MKTRFTFPLFAFAGLLAASQPLLAAAPKADARAAALVAALQAVSPDPLGGRLGLTASAVGQPAPTRQNSQNQTLQAKTDQRAYASWKVATKPWFANAMFRVRPRWIAVISLVVGTAAAARALPTATQIKAAFTALDTTENNAINLTEWDRGSFALFHAADKNKNDFIDADELQASNIAQDTFLHADTDHDGRLSIGEFMELRRALFQIADIDRDDSLIYVEFELLLVLEQVGWIDRNHDGRIELSELRDSLAKAFEQLDVDHDGKLSAAEAAFMPAAEFKAFDKNADGQLTLDEFTNGYRAALLGG